MRPLPGVCRRCRGSVWAVWLFGWHWMDALDYDDLPQVFDNVLRGKDPLEGFPVHVCAVNL